MIKTKSIYAPKEDKDGLRVLITRFYPRGIKKTHFDNWIKDLAPSKELLREYKSQNISWSQLTSGFKSELQENPNSILALNDLKTKSKIKTITLLCFEKTGEPCHRHLLKKIIQNSRNLKKEFNTRFED